MLSLLCFLLGSLQHVSMFLFLIFGVSLCPADPGLSADTGGVAEAQSGAAPTAEGQFKNSFCFLTHYLCGYSVQKGLHTQSSQIIVLLV